jgi:fluoroquinolone resistance protein
MEPTFIDSIAYNKIDFKETALKKGEYENCIFNNCDFSGSDLSDIKFIECSFNGCNLSLAKLVKTTFCNITFRDCKMLGLRFDSCNEFGLSFSVENCTLNHSTFYQLKIKKTIFKNSHLIEADFTESDLTASIFDNCDLTGTTFENTNVEKTDFRTSHNYSIDPENNRIKKAKFSLSGLVGLLDKYDIEIDNLL